MYETVRAFRYKRDPAFPSTRPAPSLGSAALLAGAVACGSGHPTHVPADAGTEAAPPIPGVAGRTANAALAPVPGAVERTMGLASFTSTESGVDLTIDTSGCTGLSGYPVRILEGDCSAASLGGPVWDDPRGTDIAALTCTGPASNVGRLHYARSGRTPATAWQIGTGSPSDLVGHALAMFDATTDAPVACGLIERGPDVGDTGLPPLTEGPPAAVRAAVAGMCLTRTFPPSVRTDCPDAAALVACSAEHCGLGACLETCADYTACLQELADPCDGLFTCSASPACQECQNLAVGCAFSFCATSIACAAPLTPDGPCSQLDACCALQGERAADCLSLAQSLAQLGGDPSCVSAMNDWDVFSHMHVPCPFLGGTP